MGRKTSPGAHVDDGRLQRAHVLDHINGGGQANDRVDRELAGAVPCGLPAPVDVEDRYVARFDEGAVGSFPGVRSAAHRVDGLVLEEDERRGAAPIGDIRVDPPLELPPLAEGDQAGAEVEVQAVHTVTIDVLPGRRAERTRRADPDVVRGRPRTIGSYPQGASNLVPQWGARGPWLP